MKLNLPRSKKFYLIFSLSILAVVIIALTIFFLTKSKESNPTNKDLAVTETVSPILPSKTNTVVANETIEILPRNDSDYPKDWITYELPQLGIDFKISKDVVKTNQNRLVSCDLIRNAFFDPNDCIGTTRVDDINFEKYGDEKTHEPFKNYFKLTTLPNENIEPCKDEFSIKKIATINMLGKKYSFDYNLNDKDQACHANPAVKISNDSSKGIKEFYLQMLSNSLTTEDTIKMLESIRPFTPPDLSKNIIEKSANSTIYDLDESYNVFVDSKLGFKVLYPEVSYYPIICFPPSEAKNYSTEVNQYMNYKNTIFNVASKKEIYIKHINDRGNAEMKESYCKGFSINTEEMNNIKQGKKINEVSPYIIYDTVNTDNDISKFANRKFGSDCKVESRNLIDSVNDIYRIILHNDIDFNIGYVGNEKCGINYGYEILYSNKTHVIVGWVTGQQAPFQRISKLGQGEFWPLQIVFNK